MTGRHSLLLLTALLAHAVSCRQVDEAASDLPFSRAIRVGSTLYVSGHAASHADGVDAATHVVMRKLQAQLEAHGFSYADVVASCVWLTNLEASYPKMNGVYAGYFDGDYPSRTTVGVSALPGGAAVEIALVAAKGERRAIYPAGVEAGRLPFSPGILAGDTLYISGQAGVDPDTGKLVSGDIGAHVGQTMRNIERVLNAAGMDFSHAVSAWVYLKDGDDFRALSEAYVPFLKDPKPVRIPVAVESLPLDSPVEITVVACRTKGEPIWPDGKQAGGTYSPGVAADRRVYVAGAGLREGTITEQVDHCLDRFEKTLTAAGLTLDDIVETRVYLTDLNDYAEMNEAYRARFSGKQLPTRATIGVPRLVSTFRMYMGVVAAQRR